MSTVMGSIGSFSQGMTQYQAGKEQMRTAKRQSYYKMAQSKAEVAKMEADLSKLQGTQKARYGASGVKMEGSPMDVMLATEREGRNTIAYKKLMDMAQVQELLRAGKLAQRAGGMAALGSTISGFSNIGSGAYKMSNNWGSEGAWSLLG
jgi:hypothetical protein